MLLLGIFTQSTGRNAEIVEIPNVQQKNENIKTLVALKLGLNDSDHKTRMQAARELSLKGTCEAVDAIIARLEQERLPSVRKVMSRALIKIDHAHVLVALAHSKIDFERNLSVQWLQRYGRRHVGELLAIFKDEKSIGTENRELMITMCGDFAGKQAESFVKCALEDSHEAVVIAGARVARMKKMDALMPTVEKVFSQWSEKMETEEIRSILSKLSIDPADMTDLAEFERKLILTFNTQAHLPSEMKPSYPSVAQINPIKNADSHLEK